ncbi:MAG: hypothetical protein AB1553_04940 [Nitrospirota bacterium]
MQKIRRDEAGPSMVIAFTVRGKDGNILFTKRLSSRSGLIGKGSPMRRRLKG